MDLCTKHLNEHDPHTELRNEISELLHNGLKKGLILALDFGPIGFKNSILTVIVCNSIIISKIVSGNFFLLKSDKLLFLVLDFGAMIRKIPHKCQSIQGEYINIRIEKIRTLFLTGR